MDRVAARAFCDLDQPRRVEIALLRRGSADGIGGVRGSHVECVAVDVAVHRDRAHPKVVTRADDPKRDLAAIRDEYGGQRRRGPLERDVAVLTSRIRFPLPSKRA